MALERSHQRLGRGGGWRPEAVFFLRSVFILIRVHDVRRRRYARHVTMASVFDRNSKREGQDYCLFCNQDALPTASDGIPIYIMRFNVELAG